MKAHCLQDRFLYDAYFSLHLLFHFLMILFFSFLVSQHICRVTFYTSDQPYLTISSLQCSKPVKEYIFLRHLKATRHLTYSKYTKLLGLMGLHFLLQHLPEQQPGYLLVSSDLAMVVASSGQHRSHTGSTQLASARDRLELQGFSATRRKMPA